MNKLTAEFDLKAMTFSRTAERYNIAEQYTPPPDVVENLKALHEHVIVPLVNALPGDLTATCAYRCTKVNAKVGSKPTSQHPKGMAADLEYRENGVEMNHKIIEAVNWLELDYDQMIAERIVNGKPSWVHISYNHNHNRKQFFKL